MVTLFLAGDVMTGRGVDQVLRHPGDPALREGHLTDARRYVALAEAANGPIPRPVPDRWPWGDALEVLDRAAPDVRLVNLETAVTGGGAHAPGKVIHYRMEPANLGCLTAARLDAVALANNHVLDFGAAGLAETLDVLRAAGIRTAGAGRTAGDAARPAAVPLREGRRVLVWSVAHASSGVPGSWAAGPDRAGVALLDELGPGAAARLAARVRAIRRPGEIAVVSVHWGSNWGYDVPAAHVAFAHALVDGGVDVVHGHSSHHPRPVEVYRDRLVLYGCGDLVNDYEGIGGYEAYRTDLRPVYLARLRPDGALRHLRVVVFQARRMRLWRASEPDVRWFRRTIRAVSRPFGTRVLGHIQPGEQGALFVT